MVRIAGIGGSLREGSYSLGALRFALDAAGDEGAETRLLGLDTLDLPLYDPDKSTPEAYGEPVAGRVRHLLDTARWADGFIWSSPAYHGAVSGAFKNALDYLQFLVGEQPSYLYGKVVAGVSVGGGTIGPVDVVMQMTQIAVALRAEVVPLLVPITNAQQAFAAGMLVHPQSRDRLTAMARELARLASMELAQRPASAWA